jgi:hypothetical protein
MGSLFSPMKRRKNSLTVLLLAVFGLGMVRAEHGYSTTGSTNLDGAISGWTLNPNLDGTASSPLQVATDPSTGLIAVTHTLGVTLSADKSSAMLNAIAQTTNRELFQTTATSAPLAREGWIQAFIVQGDVKLVNPDGTITPLVRGGLFQEGCLVRTGVKSDGLLVLSNGSTIKIEQNSELKFTEFKQAPFDAAAAGGTFLRLTKDPSKSTTVLDLNYGTIQGDIKDLDADAGSTYTLNVPEQSIGLSGSRGEGFSATVERNSAGQIQPGAMIILSGASLREKSP